jgi:hypothetical protein
MHVGAQAGLEPLIVSRREILEAEQSRRGDVRRAGHVSSLARRAGGPYVHEDLGDARVALLYRCLYPHRDVVSPAHGQLRVNVNVQVDPDTPFASPAAHCMAVDDARDLSGDLDDRADVDQGSIG